MNWISSLLCFCIFYKIFQRRNTARLFWWVVFELKVGNIAYNILEIPIYIKGPLPCFSQKLLEAANRWTDNIYMIKTWCKRKFDKEERELNKAFGIPDDLDYVDTTWCLFSSWAFKHPALHPKFYLTMTSTNLPFNENSFHYIHHDLCNKFITLFSQWKKRKLSSFFSIL